MAHKYEVREFIDGTMICDLSDSQILDKISSAKAEIRKLKAVDVESTSVAIQIAKLEEFVSEAVAVLDSRVSDADAADYLGEEAAE